MRRRLRIALYEMTVTMSYGGVQTTYWETARRLAGFGHEVHLYGGEGVIRRQLPPEVELFVFPVNEPRDTPLLGPRGRKFAQRLAFGRRAISKLVNNRYDIIYIRKPYEFPISLWVRRMTGARVVYRSGGTEFYPGYGWMASKLDAVLACSRWNAEQIHDYCGIMPEVLHNGVDLGTFSPLRQSSETRRKLGIEDGEFVCLGVGRLVAWKGFQDAIRAISVLRGRALKLVIVGDGPCKRMLMKLAEELGLLGRVVFTGAKPAEEMPDYHAIADVTLFPTTGDDDAFPNALCEAMASGKPAIGTFKGGIPECIRDNVTGFLVSPGDPGAIADRIVRLQEQPGLRLAMGESARQSAMEKLSWDDLVGKLDEKFQAVCR